MSWDEIIWDGDGEEDAIREGTEGEESEREKGEGTLMGEEERGDHTWNFIGIHMQWANADYMQKYAMYNCIWSILSKNLVCRCRIYNLALEKGEEGFNEYLAIYATSIITIAMLNIR